MNTQLYSLLNDEQDGLVSDAVNRFKTSSAEHYSRADFNGLRSKCSSLIQSLNMAVKEEHKDFPEYVRKISKDRIREGYDLDEMQFALNTIEELVWRLCLEKVADEKEKLEDLCLLTRLIESAKDGVARQYWEASQDEVAHAAPIWRKMQDAELISMRRMEGKWAKSIADSQVKG